MENETPVTNELKKQWCIGQRFGQLNAGIEILELLIETLKYGLPPNCDHIINELYRIRGFLNNISDEQGEKYLDYFEKWLSLEEE